MADARELFRRMIEEDDDEKRAELRDQYVAEIKRRSREATRSLISRRKRRRWFRTSDEERGR